MWQFAMNSPGKAPYRAGFTRPELRQVNRLLALGCFLIIAALHAVLILAFNFFTKDERSFPEPGELLLTLEFPESSPVEPANVAAAELPLPPAAPAPRAETPPPEPVLEPAAANVPVSEEAAPDNASPAEPEWALPAAASLSDSPAGAVSAGMGAVQGRANSGPAFRDLRAEAVSRYASIVHGLIDRSKAYPYQARRQEQEGTVRIRFTLSRLGYLAGDPVIENRSRYRLLNESALEAVKNAAPYPRFPEEIPEDEMSFQVAVSFSFK